MSPRLQRAERGSLTRERSGARRTRLVYLLFFVSGLASLVLETVWVRMMVLVFGSTTFALSTVLTAFMGGLALGSWLSGRRAARFADPRRALWAYGVLELVIGLYALTLPHLVGRIQWVHDALWGGLSASYYTFALLRFLLAATLLLLPTVAMGATLPVLARFFCTADDGDDVGERVGSLYAVNTTGAVFGVLLAGFVLLPWVGTRTTNLLACLADITLGLAALLLLRLTRAPKTEPAAPPPALPAALGVLPLFAMASIAVSGALAMVYQVAWTRAMSLIIGSSTYAFSLILACFLVGLAGGAWLYSRRQARQPDQAANLSVIHLLVACTALAGILFMDQLPAVLVTLMQHTRLSVTTVFLLKFLVAGAVILLPTFFMGMVFPAVVRICSPMGTGAPNAAARITGNVYAMNTMGSIVGSFGGGFLLIPLCGLQQSLVLMVMLGLLLSALCGLFAVRRVARGVLAGTAVAASIAALALIRPWNLELMTAGVFRVSRYEVLLNRGETGDVVPRDPARERRVQRTIPPAEVVDTMQEPTAGYGVVFHREGITTTVSMARTVEQSLSDAACWVRHSLLVNGKPDASLSVLHPRPARRPCRSLLSTELGPGLAISPSGDAETQILSGLLPMLLFPGPRAPRDVLVIGWGSGITVGAALQAPVRRVVAVELEQAVVQASRYFEPHNHTPLRDPRLRLVNEDGRNYLAINTQPHDVVVSEPSNPWIAGCGNLFTREFFQLVHRRLGPHGVYLQWLQSYEIAPQNVWSILGTLQDVFPSTYVFRPVQSSADLLIVAMKERGTLDVARIARRMALPGVRRELARVQVRRPADVVARLLAGPRQIQRTSRGAPRNTDDNARIEFATPRDLINYRHYSSSAISRRLGATLTQRLAMVHGARSGGASQWMAQVCHGLLLAGRPHEAASLRGAGRACAERAAWLMTPVPPLDRGTLESLGLEWLAGKPPAAALGLLIKRAERRERRAPSAVLGQLYALADRPFPALVYLLGARGAAEPRSGAERSAPHNTAHDGREPYPGLDALLARVYYERGHFGHALRLTPP